MTDAAAGHGWALTLYVNGAPAEPIEAIETVHRVCDGDLGRHVDLGTIGVRQQPVLVVRDQIVAALTPVKRLPGPLRRIVRDVSDADRSRFGLDLVSVADRDGHPHPDD